MGTPFTDKVVMSVGGSLIAPQSGIDTNFLSTLNTFIRDQIQKNPQRQFFLVTGGGATARHYQEAGRNVIGKLENEDLDWLGIHASRLNGHLMRTIFYDVAHPVIIEHYDIIQKVSQQVVVASGWKPGWSTDFCSAMLCENYDVKLMINMSNIDKVFDKDPKQFPDAKPIEHMSWDELQAIVGEKWTPGLNVPFDPIASKKGKELGLKVVVLNGNNFENLQNVLDKKEYVGTTIE